MVSAGFFASSELVGVGFGAFSALVEPGFITWTSGFHLEKSNFLKFRLPSFFVAPLSVLFYGVDQSGLNGLLLVRFRVSRPFLPVYDLDRFVPGSRSVACLTLNSLKYFALSRFAGNMTAGALRLFLRFVGENIEGSGVFDLKPGRQRGTKIASGQK